MIVKYDNIKNPPFQLKIFMAKMDGRESQPQWKQERLRGSN
jgi:hypothetical protein